MKAFILKLKIVVRWLLLLFTLAYIVTGLGILYFRIVEPLTFGVLTKALSSRIHDYLLIPFLILLVLHVVISIRTRKN
jgi:hypothetical protein